MKPRATGDVSVSEGGHATRRRQRAATVLAVAMAVGVSLIAFPASAAAAPPVVPTCAFPNTPDSDSCGTLRVNAGAPPIGGVFENIRLGVRTRSQFSPSTSETQSIQLRFDDDIALNLAAVTGPGHIPCPATELAGKNIAQAWEQCGPGADGNPPSEGNAYLSTGLGGNVSGIASTTPVQPNFPEGIFACTMVFKGANNNQLTFYFRAGTDITDPTTQCNNPATNTVGSTMVILTANLSRLPAASPYDWTLTIFNTQVVSPALDDLYVTLTRGPVFRARCPTGTSPHRMQGVFDYTAAADANDTHVATDPCP